MSNQVHDQLDLETKINLNFKWKKKTADKEILKARKGIEEQLLHIANYINQDLGKVILGALSQSVQ